MLRPFIFMCSLGLAAQAVAGEAGKVIFVAGSAQVAERAVAEGASVQEGELLTTGADGFLYVKTVDNGLFILRPNTRARIATYQVDRQNPANTRVKLELISGVARSKSGDAVKAARQNFRFNTPVAAIGVRGTDFTVYTDQDASRVAVLNGRVVVSGFGGACAPEGGGPCEGAASRELSASQRGQLLQVRRGQAAPQLVQGGGNAPDQVSPPRADEPLAKVGGAGDPSLDAKKGDSLEKLVEKLPQQPTLPVTPPPVVVDQPQLPSGPQRELQWGRWTSLAGAAPTATFAGPDGAERIVGGNYVLFRTANGPEYVTPERGSVAFNLKGGEAFVLNDDPAKSPIAAQLKNGLLNVDFGSAMFTTSFDLVFGSESYKMMADGPVSSAGRFGNNYYERPATNNMQVDGFLSNANGGSAAYIFHRRLDDTRTTNGVTYWAR
ncbi:MAG TPA: FecR family protein [Telluria sp.]|nr:FecR family protein [Telluria sp.]